MLSVEEAPVVSIPMVAVPVESPSNWMHEEKPAAEPAPPAPPLPPRFKSEEESDADEKGAADFYFTSSTPQVATSVTVAPSPVAIAEEPEPNFERAQADRDETLTVRFEEPLEPAPAAQSQRDYVADFVEDPHVQAEQHAQNTEPVASLFNEAAEEEHRDLDVPAFMRRHKF
jgi:hypothetical protein